MRENFKVQVVSELSPEHIEYLRETAKTHGIESWKNHKKVKNKKENNVDEILDIALTRLIDFPKQSEIYGEIDIEPEFVASIADRGVLTPLTVCENGDGNYVVISGHRRKLGAEKAGLMAVPCLLKEYENEEEKELDFLICNMQREKSKATRVKEFLCYKQILCQIGKVRKSKGVYVDTIFENKDFFRILKTTDIEKYIEPGKPLNSVDILKEITNYSKYEQEYLNVLYSSTWLQLALDELRGLGLPIENDNNINNKVEFAREEYEAERVSLNEAVKAIKDMFADAKRQLIAARDKKAPKAKKEKAPKAEKPRETLLLGINVKCEYSETPQKFSEANSVAEFFFKSEGMSFGIVKTTGMVTGFAVELENGVAYINPKLLAEFIRKNI